MLNSKWIRILIVAITVVTLTACSTGRRKPQDPAAIDDANAAYTDAGQTNGLGNNKKGFGDDSNGGNHQALNKRTYYFDFDSNVVHDADKPAIVANANHLAANSNTQVLLEGHTDPRGSREYNIGLGERRAKAVATILKEKGVSSNRMRIVSYGAEKPAVQGHSESDYQLDRRAILNYAKQAAAKHPNQSDVDG